jgi:outer membrane phospholipase A
MNKENYRIVFGVASLLLWIAYTTTSWFMISMEEEGDYENEAIIPIPFCFLFLDLIFGPVWLGFEANQELEQGSSKEGRVIDWMYPYTYFIVSFLTYLLWGVLWVHRLVYGEIFVDASWILFTVNNTVFIWFLTLSPFYVYDRTS